MSHLMVSSDTLIVLWTLVAVLLIAYVLRRRSRKRKQLL